MDDSAKTIMISQSYAVEDDYTDLLHRTYFINSFLSNCNNVISRPNVLAIRLMFAQICTGVTSSPRLSNRLVWNNFSRVSTGIINGSFIGSLDTPLVIRLAAVVKT
jgi:hypothetical protein